MITHEMDITDNWLAATDPANEFGEICTGLFEILPDCGSVLLTEIRANDGGADVVADRGFALNVMGANEVRRIERVIEGDEDLMLSIIESHDSAIDEAFGWLQ